MMLALIIAIPFAFAAVILLWCLCRAGRLNDEAAADALRRYREHESDDAMTARDRILARGTWPPSPDVLKDAAEYYEGEGQDVWD